MTETRPTGHPVTPAPLTPVDHGYASVEALMARLSATPDEANAFREKANDRLLLDHLMAYRVKRGWSQKDMAQRMSCSQSKISKFENGFDSTTEIGEARAYARAIGIDISLFVTRKDVKLADLIKIHTMTIRKLLDKLIVLAADDDSMKNGTRRFAEQIITDHLKPILTMFEMQVESAEENIHFSNEVSTGHYLESTVDIEPFQPACTSG